LISDYYYTVYTACEATISDMAVGWAEALECSGPWLPISPS